MRLRSKLPLLIAAMSLSKSTMVVRCGERQGKLEERRREVLERDIFGDERRGLELRPWWPWRFKEQVLSQSTDSLTNCNLFCNLGLQIINSLLQQKLLLQLAIATKRFDAIIFQRYFIATKLIVTVTYRNKNYCYSNLPQQKFCYNKLQQQYFLL